MATQVYLVKLYHKARKRMLEFMTGDGGIGSADFALAQFKLAFLLGLVAFNITDATFKATNLSFFMFFAVALDLGRRAPQAVRLAEPAPALRPAHRGVARSWHETFAPRGAVARKS